VEGLDFDPFNGGKDVEFVLSNPVCLTVIITSYAAVKIAIANMNVQCIGGNATPRIIPSLIGDLYDITVAKVSLAQGPNAACGVAIFFADASFVTILAELATIHAFADIAYKNLWCKLDETQSVILQFWRRRLQANRKNPS
jgi:hypothetical protein